MNFSRAVLFFFAALASAQVPTAIQPHNVSSGGAADSRLTGVAAPVLGYVLAAGATDLHPVFAGVAAPKLGATLTPPADTKRFYLPPREQYALVELGSNAPLTVWPMHQEFSTGVPQEPVAIPGALAHPDLVGFSPRGTAAIFYSQSENVLQVVRHLPADLVLTGGSLTHLLPPTQLAVSDDGDLAVARLEDGTLVSSFQGAAWATVPAGTAVSAWSFVAKTHDLVFSDENKQTVTLLTNTSGEWGASKAVLARNVDADLLASTKDGDQLLAAKRGTGQSWVIDLAAVTVTAQEGKQKTEALIVLRDGFEFLLAASPNVAVVKLVPITNQRPAQ